MNALRRHLALLACCAAIHGGAHAADTLYAYEGFDYAPGTGLVGLNGGTGWAGPWAFNAPGSGGTVAPGLGYTDAQGRTLVTSGGSLATDASIFFSQQTRNTVETFGAGGTSVWMSFLVRQSATPGSGVNYAQATLGQGYGFGSNAMSAGLSGGSAVVGAFYSGTEGANVPGVSVAANAVSLIVLRFDFATSGNDTLNVWHNPLLGSDPGAPGVSGSFRDYASAISGLTLAHGDFRSFGFDEIRIGSSFGAVTPVPEAQTWALFLAGLAALGLRARSPRAPNTPG